MVSVKNGINSVRVRSSPKANAIVDSFLIEFKRSCQTKSREEKITFLAEIHCFALKIWQKTLPYELWAMKRAKNVYLHDDCYLFNRRFAQAQHICRETYEKSFFFALNVCETGLGLLVYMHWIFRLPECLHFSIHQLKLRSDTTNRQMLCRWRPWFYWNPLFLLFILFNFDEKNFFFAV